MIFGHNNVKGRIIQMNMFSEANPRATISSFSPVISASYHFKTVNPALLTFWAGSLLINIPFCALSSQ